MNALFSTEVVAGLNHLLLNVLRTEEDDPDSVMFIRTFLSRYISRGRPLSGYFIVCCVIEAQWTILAQALTSPKDDRDQCNPAFVEAAAANMAWKALLQDPIDESVKGSANCLSALQSTIESSMKCFTNLLVQIEELEAEPSEDSYAWETMSESLVRDLSAKLSCRKCSYSFRNWRQFVRWGLVVWIKLCLHVSSYC